MSNLPGSFEIAKREAMVTACPDCGSFVQLPSSISIEAIVQCPSCGDQYPVRSVLPDMIPELIVVRPLSGNDRSRASEHNNGVPGKAEEIEIVEGKLNVSAILRNGARRRRRRSRSNDSPVAQPATVNSNGIAGSVTAEKNRERSRSHSRKPSRESHAWAETVKRESQVSNPAVEGMKVVVGGLMALPVAQMIIWWLIGMDPLNLAPSVAKVVPFAVPASLHSPVSKENAESAKAVTDNFAS